jgi:hypothetical protein
MADPTRKNRPGATKNADSGPGGTAPTAKPAYSPPANQVSGLSRADQDVLARAYRKVVAKEELTAAERQALRRHETDKEERLRWQYYASIPQKHWRAMSGRQSKVINEQAARYNLPFGGPSVNLPALARAIHDFLADNAVKLARDDDPLLSGGSSPALERYREERALLARLDRLEREGALLPRDEARRALGRVAAILRQAGEALARDYGNGAVDLLNEALADADAEVERAFGDGADAGARGEAVAVGDDAVVGRDGGAE